MLGCTDRRVAPGIHQTRAAAAGASGWIDSRHSRSPRPPSSPPGPGPGRAARPDGAAHRSDSDWAGSTYAVMIVAATVRGWGGSPPHLSRCRRATNPTRRCRRDAGPRDAAPGPSESPLPAHRAPAHQADCLGARPTRTTRGTGRRALAGAGCVRGSTRIGPRRDWGPNHQILAARGTQLLDRRVLAPPLARGVPGLSAGVVGPERSLATYRVLLPFRPPLGFGSAE
jgi:hypothetical protein